MTENVNLVTPRSSESGRKTGRSNCEHQVMSQKGIRVDLFNDVINSVRVILCLMQGCFQLCPVLSQHPQLQSLAKDYMNL